MWKEFTITRTDFKTSNYSDVTNCALCKAARRVLGDREIRAGSDLLRVDGVAYFLTEKVSEYISNNTREEYKGNNLKFKLNIPKQLL